MWIASGSNVGCVHTVTAYNVGGRRCRNCAGWRCTSCWLCWYWFGYARGKYAGNRLDDDMQLLYGGFTSRCWWCKGKWCCVPLLPCLVVCSKLRRSTERCGLSTIAQHFSQTSFLAGAMHSSSKHFELVELLLCTCIASCRLVWRRMISCADQFRQTND